MKLRKGDQVKVLSGKDKGKIGAITKVLVKTNQVIVEGVNVMKRHTKPSQANQDGGIIEITSPINASNVALVEGKAQTPTKVGFRIEKEKKVRFAKKTGQTIS